MEVDGGDLASSALPCGFVESAGERESSRTEIDRCTTRSLADAHPGSHAIWHVFIVLAMRAHRDGIREMRRAAETGGCAIGV